MKKLFLPFLISLLGIFLLVRLAHADTTTDNAFSYIQSQQNAAGQVTNGFSAPSQWSAIAFAADGENIATIKTASGSSLFDFLLTDAPGNNSGPTDWENRILAIVATDNDPTNFGGINYVSHLESFYNNNQIGDTCSLNDDIFGLMAELAAGTSASSEIEQNTLSFLLKNQDTTDGGFSYSAPGCSYYGTSADITGAAAVTLVAAKNQGMTGAGLDDAIASVSAYLTSHQDSDGGYGYYGTSDADTTGWALQGLNALGLQNSTAAASAKIYLLSQQSQTDGGFMDFNYTTNQLSSNTTTTAQALIALLGKTWILRIFSPTQITPTTTPNQTISPSPTPTTTPTPTITPTPNTVYVTTTNTITNTVYVTPTPEIIYKTVEKILAQQPSPTAGVLGSATADVPQTKTMVEQVQGFSFSSMFLGMGIAFLGFYAMQLLQRLFKRG